MGKVRYTVQGQAQKASFLWKSILKLLVVYKVTAQSKPGIGNIILF
jgi:hypothetical protein